MTYQPRYLQEKIRELSSRFGAILVAGPRQAGKTWHLTHTAAAPCSGRGCSLLPSTFTASPRARGLGTPLCVPRGPKGRSSGAPDLPLPAGRETDSAYLSSAFGAPAQRTELRAWRPRICGSKSPRSTPTRSSHRTSNPVFGVNSVAGGFDSHAPPPARISRRYGEPARGAEFEPGRLCVREHIRFQASRSEFWLEEHELYWEADVPGRGGNKT